MIAAMIIYKNRRKHRRVRGRKARGGNPSLIEFTGYARPYFWNSYRDFAHKNEVKAFPSDLSHYSSRHI
jgi:hypothetical protein